MSRGLRLPYELVAPPVQFGPVPWPRGHQHRSVDGPGSVLVVVGGGRRMVEGAAHAAAAGLDWVAVPTTYAPAWAAVRPAPVKVLADPTLPGALPEPLRAESLAAARAVAVEALWAPDSTPSVRWVALSAFRTLHGILTEPRAVDEAAAQQAAMLAAVGAANCAPGLLSTLGRALEDRGVAWARVVSAMLPRVARWQGSPVRDALATVADVAGRADWRQGADVLDAGDLPPLSDRVVEEVVADVLARPHLSPRVPEADDLRDLLVALQAR